MLLENLADLLDVLVQEVLPLVVLHPVRHQRPAAAHNPGNPLAHQRDMLAQHTRVNRHVIHTLLGLLLDHFQHQPDGQVFRPPDPGDRFIHRHRPHGHRRCANNRLSNHRDVPTSREVHHRIRAIVHGVMQLLQFLIDVRACRGISAICVDLTLRGDPDRHRLQVAVMDIGGNDAPPPRYLRSNQLRLQLFALGNELHLLSCDALARQVHLRNVPVSVRPGNTRFPLFNPAIAQSHRAPSVLGDGKRMSRTTSQRLTWNYGTWGWARQLGDAQTKVVAGAATLTNHSCAARRRPVPGCTRTRSAPWSNPDQQADSALPPARLLRPPPPTPETAHQHGSCPQRESLENIRPAENPAVEHHLNAPAQASAPQVPPRSSRALKHPTASAAQIRRRYKASRFARIVSFAVRSARNIVVRSRRKDFLRLLLQQTQRHGNRRFSAAEPERANLQLAHRSTRYRLRLFRIAHIDAGLYTEEKVRLGNPHP